MIPIHFGFRSENRPRLVDFHRNFGAYWLKDDHDTPNNDSWVGARTGALTFAEGQRIFRQQAPMADGPGFRNFRWGRDLQIWLTEGRDFRSPNKMSDGPEKTIRGKKQKEWLERTVKESDATWKVLISPTPLVGPDRRGNITPSIRKPGCRSSVPARLATNMPADHPEMIRTITVSICKKAAFSPLRSCATGTRAASGSNITM